MRTETFFDNLTTWLGDLNAFVQHSLVLVQGRRFGHGAGVIWRKDGIILTNNHVVGFTADDLSDESGLPRWPFMPQAGQRKTGRGMNFTRQTSHPWRPKVTLADGRSFEARVLARDPEIDLALLSIPAEDLPAVPFRPDERLRVGELVFALGHPWGQQGTVTAGVVSALTQARTRPNGRPVPVIRIDAALAPGNSGGPLVNAGGCVVGINTLIVGGDQGVAISAEAAAQFIDRALTPGGQEKMA